jgi:hypothetical protein
MSAEVLRELVGLAGAGFTDVRTLPGPPHSVVALVAARAP